MQYVMRKRGKNTLFQATKSHVKLFCRKMTEN